MTARANRKNEKQVRLDPDRVRVAKEIIADVKKQSGRELSMTLVANMAMGLGLPSVREKFVGHQPENP